MLHNQATGGRVFRVGLLLILTLIAAGGLVLLGYSLAPSSGTGSAPRAAIPDAAPRTAAGESPAPAQVMTTRACPSSWNG